MAEAAETTPARTNGAARAATATTTRPRRASRARRDDLEAQIERLQGDIGKIASTLARMGETKVDEVRGLAKQQANAIKGKGEELVETAQDEFGAFEKQIKDTIREKPLTAVAGAIALGFLVAVITR